MGGPLALPPTAIRRVNAGLIVGNPVGSSNTRAKALTSAELKAIIEASGISYLPLSGGTLTDAFSVSTTTTPAITVINPSANNAIIRLSRNNGAYSWDLGMRQAQASVFQIYDGNANLPRLSIGTDGACAIGGNLSIRNNLTAMQAEVFTTYTSATSFESLCLKATASAMQIGSARGSAGGTNRPVQLGHFDAAGTFTNGLSVATNGAVTCAGTVTVGTNLGFYTASGGATVNVGIGTTACITAKVTFANVAVNSGWGISPTGNVSQDPDVKLIRNATGPAWIATANGGLQVRNLANSSDAPLTCSTITASSDLTLVPSSSRTLSTNGQFSIEMTSNTAGNLVYRGSDGTERRNPQVFYASGSMQRTLVHAPTWSTYTPAGAATATLLLSDTGSNLHRVTRPVSGDITIAFSGDSANQLFLLVLQTSGSGTPGTVTWPSGITWLTDSGAAPTISTAIDKTDSIMFQRTGSGTYLGWHTGKN